MDSHQLIPAKNDLHPQENKSFLNNSPFLTKQPPCRSSKNHPRSCFCCFFLISFDSLEVLSSRSSLRAPACRMGANRTWRHAPHSTFMSFSLRRAVTAETSAAHLDLLRSKRSHVNLRDAIIRLFLRNWQLHQPVSDQQGTGQWWIIEEFDFNYIGTLLWP